MQIRVINHHLIQEGDAYGLIYALVLNRILRIGGLDTFAFFYVNRARMLGEKQYREKIERRIGYFTSFGLAPDRFKVVHCAFSKTTKKITFSTAKNQLVISANAELFKSNPRLVSLFLTGHENDIGKKNELMEGAYLDLTMSQESQLREAELREGDLGQLHAEIAKDEADVLRKQFRAVATQFLRRSLDRRPARTESLELSFAYISKSTSYVLKCVQSAGYDVVVKTLREAVLTATRAYTSDNNAYLDRFTNALFEKAQQKTIHQGYDWTRFSESKHRDDPIIVLFWIRGTKPDEKEAIFDRSSKSSPGKPQHHTNLVLYKLVRALVNSVSTQTKRPLLFVPIGDELTETTVLSIDRVTLEYRKSKKDYNLIKFFSDSTFTGKPMGAQINFLLRLATRHQVIQVGMRSGSMERLMYLGVPTVFFDRGRDVPDLPGTVGHGRIRQLCGFAGQREDELLRYMAQCSDMLTNPGQRRGPGFKGYPLFFHIENRDTGFLRYSAFSGVTVDRMVSKLLSGIDVRAFNEFKFGLIGKRPLYTRSITDFVKVGGLEREEIRKLSMMLWFISEVFPQYSISLGARTSISKSLVTRAPNVFSVRLEQTKREIEQQERERLRHKQELRENAEREVDFNGFFDIFAREEEENH